MAKGYNEFLEGLKFEGGETSQIEVAEEAIKKHLFRMVNDLEMENGESIDINKIVELIADKLGLQAYKIQISKYITQLLQKGKYQFDIDDNGNIRANYSRLYMIQKDNDRRGREEANKILQGFVKRVEEYASQLEQKNIKVTESSLQNQFCEEELNKNANWIDIAIFSVMENRNQEK